MDEPCPWPWPVLEPVSLFCASAFVALPLPLAMLSLAFGLLALRERESFEVRLLP